MFITLGWFLFGVAVVAGGALVVNGVQSIAGKLPGLFSAILKVARIWMQRRRLWLAWLLLMRAQNPASQEQEHQAESVDVETKKERP